MKSGIFRQSLIAGLITALPLHAVFAEPQSPAEIFGFQPGDDYKLASYAQMETYYRQLAVESDRVTLREIGHSVLDRPLFLLTISTPGNLANVERYQSISEQLARARVDRDTAEALTIEGRAVVWIDAGLHATEVAHAQMAPQLAHRVATEESAEMQAIRENVIFLLMPVMNPDGLEIVRKWYESQLDTPYEQTSPPELYHHYVGHDNNRDFFMNNMPESKAVAKILYNEWYPQIVYNQHQSSPGYARIVIPPYSDPLNPNIHPGVTNALNEIGSAMGTRFAIEKMPGAISDVGFSMWWNGGMRTVPYFHNMIGILTETGHSSASPRFYDPRVFPKTLAVRANPGGVGIVVDEDDSGVPDARVLYSSPYEGGESHFSEPVDYMITGSIAVLRAASDSRMKWLTNIYLMGRDAIEAGEERTRYYVIPADQPHFDEAINLVNILYEGGIEIDQATESFRIGDERYAAGSWIVPAAQAFRPYIVDLLEEQVYPDTRLDPNGDIKPPYDIAGWTLPMQMGVRVDRVTESPDVDTSAVQEIVTPPPGQIDGNASYGYALDRETNVAVTVANAMMDAGDKVFITTEDSNAGAAGTFVIKTGEGTAGRIEAHTDLHGLNFRGLRREPNGKKAALRRPVVGIYKSHVASMDEGWTRWVLETHGFDLVSLHDSDLRSADLSTLDAILLPHPDGRVYFRDNVTEMLYGHSPGSMPDQYTGGMGLEGALALKQFAENGGTILAFGSAVTFTIEQFGLPIRDVVASAPSKSFSIPGSLIRAENSTDDPLTWGMDNEFAVNFVRGMAFDTLSQEGCVDDLLNQRNCEEILRGARPLKTFESEQRFDSIVDYAEIDEENEDDILMSGWAAGTQFIAGKSAMARVPLGEGEVIVYGFRPQFRGQPRGTYKLVFNALLNAAMEK
ncbi:MAG: M14 family metallopeptidase [Woeseiaceae bacterium]|nr:M14 family metallopeptidase [Woeseiaceae bacterium]